MHTVRSRPWTFFAGSVPDGKQVLLGWVWDFVGVIVFDKDGEILETKEVPIGMDPKQGFGPAVEAKVAKLIRTLKRQLRFHSGPIRVKSFAIEAWKVSLRRFRSDLQEFLESPERFSKEDAECYQRDIQEWKAEDRCALKWGNDYDLDRDGYTI